jgi:hypothetical protein
MRTSPGKRIDVDYAYWKEIAIDAPLPAARAAQARMR